MAYDGKQSCRKIGYSSDCFWTKSPAIQKNINMCYLFRRPPPKLLENFAGARVWGSWTYIPNRNVIHRLRS